MNKILTDTTISEVVETTEMFGIRFGLVDQDELSHLLVSRKVSGGFICFVNTYVVVLANENHELRKVVNRSLFSVMDGSPLAWTARSRGLSIKGTISGYWLMKSLLDSPLSHFFYGTYPESLLKFETTLGLEYPNAAIKGYLSPPMISDQHFDWESLKGDIQKIRDSKADIIWVGISSPKQDHMMSYLAKQLPHGTCLGVGAVFDYVSGVETKSPEWIKRVGLRWFYRLLQNPKKHFKKYLVYNTRFLVLILKDTFRIAS